MPKYQRNKPLTISQQKAGIIRTYPNLIERISKRHDILDCIIKLQPSEESQEYNVRIIYNGHGRPRVWLIDPPIEQFNGKFPHHLYGKDEKGNPELCVFDPQQDGWNSQKLIATVFIPWVVTWLYTYEIWLITGKWIYPEGGRFKNS